jgi:hypothetical protein
VTFPILPELLDPDGSTPVVAWAWDAGYVPLAYSVLSARPGDPGAAIALPAWRTDFATASYSIDAEAGESGGVGPMLALQGHTFSTGTSIAWSGAAQSGTVRFPASGFDTYGYMFSHAPDGFQASGVFDVAASAPPATTALRVSDGVAYPTNASLSATDDPDRPLATWQLGPGQAPIGVVRAQILWFAPGDQVYTWRVELAYDGSVDAPELRVPERPDQAGRPPLGSDPRLAIRFVALRGRSPGPPAVITDPAALEQVLNLGYYDRESSSPLFGVLGDGMEVAASQFR